MEAAPAHLNVAPTMTSEKQVAEIEDLKAWDQLLDLSLELVKLNLQNLKNTLAKRKFCFTEGSWVLQELQEP